MNITNPEKIKALLETPEFLSIRNSEEFYFQKGQDKLRESIDLKVSENTKAELIILSKDYHQFKTVSETRSDLKPVAELLYTIISYCDVKALKKDFYNQYSDKRTIARANVRMNAWLEHIVNYKFAGTATDSILNAFNYLLNPIDGINVLSENHRAQISTNILDKPYEKDAFISDIKACFDGYNFTLKNEKNETHLISRILYTCQSDWLDEIIGLMAADNTGWQDDFVNESKSSAGLVLWNHRIPTGKQNTIKALRTLINEGLGFNLYYSAQNQVRYKAEIMDIAVNQQELDNWKIEDESRIYNFRKNFSDYKNDNKAATIVFLASKFEKIEPIEVNKFSFYKSSPPRQINVSPVKSEPEEISTIYMEHSNTTDNIMDQHSFKAPLNQILYGPPGTGKTYHTINKALKAIGDPIANNPDRNAVKKRFDELVNEGRIVFTTFHQSLSYEDFIEGLKPDTDAILTDSPSIAYKMVDGIFKRIAKRAAQKEHKIIQVMGETSELTKEMFKDLYRNLSDTLPSNKSDTSHVILETKEKNQFALFRNSAGSITIRPLSGKTDMSVAHNELEAVLFDQKAPTYPSYEQPVINKILTDHVVTSKQVNNTKKNYVIIIDEINRGNVSQIFGELITLIEEDKREKTVKNDDDLSEALRVKLPYSKSDFSVPDNLYIIGTMNTADRSVEALDSALRRRFVFEEMTPQPDKIPEIRKKKGLSEKIGNIDLNILLSTINNRIEKLLDRDHTIGHSYFLSCKGIEDLKNTFYKNIIPLLQEYFYGDYAKIGLVLGTGFVKVKNDKDVTFAEFEHESLDIFNDRKIYEIVDHRLGDKHVVQIKGKSVEVSFEEALRLLLGQEIATSNDGEE